MSEQGRRKLFRPKRVNSLAINPGLLEFSFSSPREEGRRRFVPQLMDHSRFQQGTSSMPLLSAYQKARRHLCRTDEVLRLLIQQVGPCTLRHDPDPFAVLVRSIIAQQISSRAAMAISNRLLQAIGVLTPRTLLSADEETLRQAGLSAPKRLALLDLATRVDEGSVRLDQVRKMTDEEVIAHLLPVRGIGRWTAEMFLIFGLGRLDVLPVGDFGLKAGVQRLYRLDELPDRERLHEIAAPWAPYRSVGTWYVWRSFGPVPQS